MMLTIGTVASGAAAPQSQDTPALGVYLALGDSVAAGIGATAPDQQGYVARVFDALRTNGGGITALSNLAIPGEDTSSFINGGQLDRAVAAIADPQSNVQVVSLSMGANDFLRLLAGGPCVADPTGPACQELVARSMATFAQNYPIILQRLTDALATRGNGGMLFVHTYYNPFSGTGTAFEGPVDLALQGSDGTIDCDAANEDPSAWGVNDYITCLGAMYGANVVDVQPLFAGRGPALTLIGRSDAHPNNTGHAVIADALTAAVLASR
jgi:lysophospholipase L1-like esterase